jgi:DNA-binding NarL/FixJ family response regulator
LPKVLIADDHAIVRAGYRQFLESEPGITNIGEASNAQEVLDQLRVESWDLVLLDIQMPDRSGLDLLKYICAQYRSVLVLITSGLPEELYAGNALRAGARGYLSKGTDPEEVLQAIRTVLAGRRYVSAAFAEQMAADLDHGRNQGKPLHSSLSTRELQTFCKIAGGSTVAQIAAELSLSAKTVSTYRSRILEKMCMKSNTDITAYALRNGLIQ